MRRGSRATLVVIGAALALAATAVAAAYRTGTYTAGNTATGAGVHMTIERGSFSVQVIRYREHCAYGSRSGADYFRFSSGTAASLTGKIGQTGRFSGRFTDGAGIVTVTGGVQGSNVTITSAEHGPYNPASTVQPNFCHGSHAFRATWRAG